MYILYQSARKVQTNTDAWIRREVYVRTIKSCKIEHIFYAFHYARYTYVRTTKLGLLIVLKKS